VLNEIPIYAEKNCGGEIGEKLCSSLDFHDVSLII
jgi:hypothetical protein